MKKITYELIDKFTEGSSAEAILQEFRPGKEGTSEPEEGSADGIWYYALSPDRVNVLEGLPWTKEMAVLQLGAQYGVFAALSDRVSHWDILDPEAEELELVRQRFPQKEGNGLQLYSELQPAAQYDIAVLSLLDSKAALADLARHLGAKPKDETPAELAYSLMKAAAGYIKQGGHLCLLSDNAKALRYLTGEKPDPEAFLLDADELGRLAGTIPAQERDWAEKPLIYYPLPNAAFARNIFSESRMPDAGDFKGISDSFLAKRYVQCNEEAVYANIAEAGAFHRFAPSWLVILTKTDQEDSAAADVHTAEFPVYLRYNRGRAPQYALKTEVYSNPEGAPAFVRKTALLPEGNAHIEGFAGRYELISREMPAGAKAIRPEIGYTAAGLAFAQFPFIRGRELAKLLADEIKEGKAPEGRMRELLSRFVGQDKEHCHNQDLLFENIIVEDTACILLDYEWVQPEGVDPQFVKYRMLRYWYEAYKEQLYGYEDLQEFLQRFDITADQLPVLEEREAAFQAEVLGSGERIEDAFRKTARTPAQIRDMESRLKEFTEWNLRLQDEIEEHKTALRKEREVERLSQNHIRNIEQMNAAKDAQLAALSSEINWLENHQSMTSKVVRKAVRKLDAWAPAESRRRKMIHLLKNTVRHPLKQCRLYLTAEGRNYIAGDFNIGGEFAEGGVLQVPQTGEPLVSIVIPAYNQVAYTYACIRSILANTDFNETPYEIILADDVSKDATAEIGRYIRGLVISRNSSNMGFLKNCNQAAAKARGKYIFFLNNDTKVHENWLSSLTDLMESDDSIGMVGSKLVYPDGRLQEAGGIIWSDASGWNYGRLDDPSKPEYNYVKDVDYISGAAIMLSRALWEEIGGFDERYAPAYCEDSDLAFEVRRHGKRVVYQPCSVVTHFEGISNGTDVNGTGLKRYQVVNQQTFREKWAEELKKQAVNTGNPDPFKARDRSLTKPCVVVVDHYVPTWDKDAGSRTTYQYIRMFLKKGFNVKFVGDNFLHEEPYATALEQMGVEILWGQEYQNNIFDWFRKNDKNIDFCYLNRPHIAVKYIDYLKENTGIRCIFYGHDLHYLRLLREFELTGEIRKKRESDYWKSVEFSVMEKADMVYYPSETEIEAIHSFHPEIPARAITAYVWDSFPAEKKTSEDYARRQNLLFVGGFRHPPNADGVKWFVSRVWPGIHEAFPGSRFLIAGSGADEEILSLASAENGIEVLGFVSDERLEELYEEARVVVVPLRYGAGVKGKVVEAIYHGCPVVTTEVGAEGIPEAESVMRIASEEAFAEAVTGLLGDASACAALHDASRGYIQNHYSYDAAWEVIREDWTLGE